MNRTKIARPKSAAKASRLTHVAELEEARREVEAWRRAAIEGLCLACTYYGGRFPLGLHLRLLDPAVRVMELHEAISREVYYDWIGAVAVGVVTDFLRAFAGGAR